MPETGTEETEKPSKAVQSTNLNTTYYRSFSDIPNAKKIAKLFNAEEAISAQRNEEGLENLKPSMVFIEARYKAIDALIRRSGVKQVVDFAAGRTPRGINNPEWNYIHTDQDSEALSQMEYIAKLLAEPRESPHFVKFDAITGEGMGQIISYLRPEPVAIVHEGLMTYYGFETKKKIAANARVLLEQFGGVYITPDIHTNITVGEQLSSIYPNWAERQQQRSKKYGRDFSTMRFENQENALAFFSDLGFKAEVWRIGDLVPTLSSPSALFEEPEKQKLVSSVILNRKVWLMTLK